MTENRLLDLVDACDFRTLFIDELGWQNPDRPPLTFEVDGCTYTLTQVAGYKGLRIWHCPTLPPRRAQREIDVLVGKDNLERLVIFTDKQRQEWRWPRRRQLGSTNAKLVVHQHLVGDRATHLTARLRAIEIDFDEDLPLVTLLERMRDAFDREAETASVAAARLMGTLYTHLENAGVGEHDATLLLARLLFLFFGDDADMWKPAGLFERYLRENTTPEKLHQQLIELFDVLDQREDRRDLVEGSPLADFKYINGGLFHGELRLPALPADFRDALLEACDFDWSVISPAIFGSMFQTVKRKENRRRGGEHYTSEENILKTIRPLFLDEYRDRLKGAWNDKGRLTKLHNDLAKLRFFDPACGCGNFLVVAYRELRALELEILRRRRDLDMRDGVATGGDRSQLTLDVTGDIKITLDHFFGIEIEEWPARIAETAMLLVDHLANQQMAEEFGVAPDRLPIAIAPKIVHANALRTDWNSVLQASGDVIILGNPPFSGDHTRDREQLADLQAVWGTTATSRLDYVTGWYKKAIDYYGDAPGRFAFVSTNSVAQGDQTHRVFGPIFEAGWRIRFAHRTFAWTSEAANAAVVHCIIVGFDRGGRGVPAPVIYTYTDIKAAPEAMPAKNINGYLLDGPDFLVGKRSTPLSPSLPEVFYGSKPSDGSFLVITPEQYPSALADASMAPYIRPYIGTREMLYNKQRWCLWMVDADIENLAPSPELQRRLDGVKLSRLESRAESTREWSDRPHLFRQIGFQSGEQLVAIPEVSSGARRYLPIGLLEGGTIVSNKIYSATDPDGFLFAIASSSMLITWMKAVGGRMKSDPSFSSTIMWNNFPLPRVSAKQRAAISEAGRGVLAARALHPERTLAEAYDQYDMSSELLAAHKHLDIAVDAVFALRGEVDEDARLKALYAAFKTLSSTQ